MPGSVRSGSAFRSPPDKEALVYFPRPTTGVPSPSSLTAPAVSRGVGSFWPASNGTLKGRLRDLEHPAQLASSPTLIQLAPCFGRSNSIHSVRSPCLPPSLFGGLHSRSCRVHGVSHLRNQQGHQGRERGHRPWTRPYRCFLQSLMAQHSCCGVRQQHWPVGATITEAVEFPDGQSI